jgi:preprotein translocase subunit YajC
MTIIAQTTVPAAPPTTQKDPPSWVNSPIIPLLLLVVIMYVFMFRGQKGKEQKRTQMLSKMKKGDEVQTIGGEFGRVVDVRDDRVLLKVDETSNAKIWYSLNAIHRIVTEEKAETK